jgi:hypothetical protein
VMMIGINSDADMTKWPKMLTVTKEGYD